MLRFAHSLAVAATMFLALALTGGLAACGTKGPLVMPPPRVPASPPPAAAAPADDSKPAGEVAK